ncbi:MAG: GntR family transcriptional regulator [Pleomorphochaeta sp.]
MARLKSNSSQKAFEELKNRINCFDLLPGDTVSDINLSKELEMSRTPIREAFQKLIQYNLVEKQRTKFVVKNVTINDITEILEAREAIEIQASKTIISNKKLTSELLIELRNIQKQIETANNINDMKSGFNLDSLFHKKIIEFTDNSRLIEIMNNLSIQGERYRWISLLNPQSNEKTKEEHFQIIRSLELRDLNMLDISINNHLETAKKNYSNILLNQDWLNILISFKLMFKNK